LGFGNNDTIHVCRANHLCLLAIMNRFGSGCRSRKIAVVLQPKLPWPVVPCPPLLPPVKSIALGPQSTRADATLHLPQGPGGAMTTQHVHSSRALWTSAGCCRRKRAVRHVSYSRHSKAVSSYRLHLYQSEIKTLSEVHNV